MSRITRHLHRKKPVPHGSFSWGRAPQTDGINVQWRLFRRDMLGRVHATFLVFPVTKDREVIAAALCVSRNKLRDFVDEIDLRHMGVTK